MKIALVASGGGHLKEISFIESFYKKHDHFFVTFERPNSISLAKKEKVHFVIDPKRNPIKLIQNIIQSITIFLKEKPDVIISTGAGVAIPICYFGKLFDAKIIFIESFCRTEEPSLTGKLVYPISDLFIYQWEKLKEFYPNVIYGGLLI
ncbi:MAG: UDP-N-acetylglucosamine--LPS N-acetylglucosamine transferase [Candidatus Aenigmarchaeota archaeon]|nr:UDP-N-acetylglucosamine--LPS N-acetylglucosamine transferase [Candidatus Aenigmarchaeota archaeon]